MVTSVAAFSSRNPRGFGMAFPLIGPDSSRRFRRRRAAVDRRARYSILGLPAAPKAEGDAMWDLKEYRIAGSPGEAVAMLRRGPGKGIYIAGGTDLFLFPPQCDFVVDINHAGLDAIARTPDGDVFVGAAATLHAIATDPFVAGYAGGLLAQAAARCGNRPVRSTATLGGNLCNALPSADLAPALLALDAVCYIIDEDSQESLPLEDFFVGPRRTVL
ncbi:hypothetical protein FJ250_09000, partial [bacterium]|nr:hypothetical protein [bacterium]